jgi:hypothetical protein
VVPFLGPNKLHFAFEAICFGPKAPCPSIELYTQFKTSIFLEQTKATTSNAEENICDQKFCFLRVPFRRHKSDCDLNVPVYHISCYLCRENSLYTFNSASEAHHKLGPASMASSPSLELPYEAKGEYEEEQELCIQWSNRPKTSPKWEQPIESISCGKEERSCRTVSSYQQLSSSSTSAEDAPSADERRASRSSNWVLVSVDGSIQMVLYKKCTPVEC